MAVNLKNIQFKYFLFDMSNMPVNDLQVIVQFYNVNVKSWISLTDELTLKDGELQYQLEIPSRISRDNQTIRVVREVLKSGGTPSFRIIKSSKKNDIPQVITSSFKAIIEGKNTLIIDFDKSWLLKDDAFIQKEDHIVIASQFPMFELTNAIREVEKQKKETTVQILSLNNTITSLSSEKELLNNELVTARNKATEKEQEALDLSESLTTLETNLKNEQALRKTLEANKTALETKVATQQKQISTYETQIADDYKDQYLELEKQVAVINKEKENLTQEKVSFLASIDQLQNEIKQEKGTIEAKDSELHTKQILINSLEKKTASLQKELEEVKDYNATAHPNKLSASKVPYSLFI